MSLPNSVAADARIYIVMPFIEHDLKTLLSDMPHPFLQSEVKTIMIQLLSAMAHCHANWIVSSRGPMISTENSFIAT